jgi:ubiquitin-like modifier-activating enzyme ATG7
MWYRLKKIFPGMRSEGVVLTIPMPGHPVPDADRESFQQTVARLDTLVRKEELHLGEGLTLVWCVLC